MQQQLSLTTPWRSSCYWWLLAHPHPSCPSPCPSFCSCPFPPCLQVVEAVAAELQAQGAQSPFKLVVDPVLVSTSGDALATAGGQRFQQAAVRPSCHSLTAPWPDAAAATPSPVATPLSTLFSPHPDLATHALPHHNTALLHAGVVEAIKRHMLPLATIVTPNLPEACKLVGGALACLSCLPAGWWRLSVAPACAGTCWTCPASCLPAACCLQPAACLPSCHLLACSCLVPCLVS
jgi:hypothetical protein